MNQQLTVTMDGTKSEECGCGGGEVDTDKGGAGTKFWGFGL